MRRFSHEMLEMEMCMEMNCELFYFLFPGNRCVCGNYWKAGSGNDGSRSDSVGS